MTKLPAEYYESKQLETIVSKLTDNEIVSYKMDLYDGTFEKELRGLDKLPPIVHDCNGHIITCEYCRIKFRVKCSVYAIHCPFCSKIIKREKEA